MPCLGLRPLQTLLYAQGKELSGFISQIQCRRVQHHTFFKYFHQRFCLGECARVLGVADFVTGTLSRSFFNGRWSGWSFLWLVALLGFSGARFLFGLLVLVPGSLFLAKVLWPNVGGQG